MLNAYTYGFNGKESDFEIHNSGGTSYDFGARIYDPRLGRWLSLDPLQKKYPYLSPYSAFGNDPINVIDPTGEELVEIIIQTKSPYIRGQLHLVVDKAIADKVMELVQYAIDNKIYVHFNSDFRSTSEQANLKNGVTPAKPGTSRHEGAFALDFQLYENNDGKTIIGKFDMANLKDNNFIDKAKGLGFRWGGEFKKKDGVHIDAWGSGVKSKFGYASFQDAYNENQNDTDVEKIVFTGKPPAKLNLNFKASNLMLDIKMKSVAVDNVSVVKPPAPAVQ